MDAVGSQEGWLMKWTNYWRRYKKRYVKIAREQLLVYKRSKHDSEMVLKHRFDISDLLIYSGNGTNFVVSDGLTTVHFKAASAPEKEAWLSSLRVTKAKAISQNEDDFEMAYKNVEIADMLAELAAKQNELKLIDNELRAEKKFLQTFYDDAAKSKKEMDLANFLHCAEKCISLTSKSVTHNQEYLSLAEKFSSSFKRFIKFEKSQVAKLETVVEQMGMDQLMLEEKLRGSPIQVEALSDDEVFFDARTSGYIFTTKALAELQTFTRYSALLKLDTPIIWLDDQDKFMRSKKQRRKMIPERLNQGANWWEVLKNSIGKDLSKLCLPVNFSEPLSVLQRLTEDLEYSICLDQACLCKDPWERFGRVVAFTVSSYSTTATRIYKPFNPILGETFECDRTDDMGWRSIAEQVSHHPPIMAMHAQSKKWILWQEQSATCKFRGKFFQVNPVGIVHLVLREFGDYFTWHKVSTTVHNIIFGKPWIENHGEMEMMNHSSGAKCVLKYIPTSVFSKEIQRKVSGMIYDKDGAPKYVISGTWSTEIEGAAVIAQKGVEANKLVFQTAPPKVLWKCVQAPEALAKCFNFTEFAVSLNEPEGGVAPTDSRLRPDQRLMEEGRWDEANKVKIQLEVIQRSARLLHEKQLNSDPNYVGYLPKWFKQETDPAADRLTHVYMGEYWDSKAAGDWSRCPDIFSLNKIDSLSVI